MSECLQQQKWFSSDLTVLFSGPWLMARLMARLPVTSPQQGGGGQLPGRARRTLTQLMNQMLYFSIKNPDAHTLMHTYMHICIYITPSDTHSHAQTLATHTYIYTLAHILVSSHTHRFTYMNTYEHTLTHANTFT